MQPRLTNLWQELNPYVDAALQLEPAARERWLNELRERAPDLADHVRAFCAEIEVLSREGFLHGHCPPVPPSQLLAGQTFGAYTLEACIGHGGTGSVWLGNRSDGRFSGKVAVKLLNTALVGMPAERRFVREGSVLARLQHPNIARLLDAGVAAVHQPYLVLELVEGTHIDTYCDEHRLGVEQRLQLFMSVLAAVAHAHNHLVIHSDIKPSNILVTPEGVVKLLDFSIAKLLHDQTEALTVAGQRAMTPQYAAPEQVQGEAITTATDVYALGVLLYQLLAGRHPTCTATANYAEAMRATLEIEPPRLTTLLTRPDPTGETDPEHLAVARGTTLPRLRRQLRGDLENIVACALKKDPTHRYSTVAALAEDVRRHLLHQPIAARADSLWYRCGKFVRRRRGAVAASLLLLTAIGAGVAGTVSQALDANTQRAMAQRERDKALQQVVYSEAKTELFNLLVTSRPDQSPISPEAFQGAIEMVSRQFADEPAVRARLQFSLGWQYANTLGFKEAHLKERQQSIELITQARDIARGLDDPAFLSQIDCALGTLYHLSGSFETARSAYDNAIARLRTLREIDDPTILPSCLQDRSLLLTMSGDPAGALVDARQAMAALGTPRAHQRHLQVSVLAAFASAQIELGDLAGAVAAYRLGLTRLENLGRKNTSDAAALLGGLGYYLFLAGQPQAAADAYSRAIDVAHRLGGTGLDGPPAAYYARALILLGRTDQAATVIGGVGTSVAPVSAYAANALAIHATGVCSLPQDAACTRALQAASSVENPEAAVLERIKGQRALMNRQPSKARTHLRRSIEVSSGGLASSVTLTLLARAECALVNLPAAETAAGQAVKEARRASAGFEHSTWLGQALVAQGMVEDARGNAQRARDTWESALEHLNATLGPDAPSVLEVQQLLGRTRDARRVASMPSTATRPVTAH